MNEPLTRRIVLLTDTGDIAEVFPCTCEDLSFAARHLALSYPGRTLAAEHLLIRKDGSSQWQRFMTVNYFDGLPPKDAIGRTWHDQRLYEGGQ